MKNKNGEYYFRIKNKNYPITILYILIAGTILFSNWTKSNL